MVTAAPASVPTAATVVTATECATTAAWSVVALEKAPKSTPLSDRALNVASSLKAAKPDRVTTTV